MKRMKKIWVIGLFFTLSLFFGNLFAKADTTEVTVFTKSLAGEVMSGVKMTVYDVTDFLTGEETAEELEKLVTPEVEVATLITDENGRATVQLENLNDRRSAGYLFTQEKSGNVTEALQSVLLTLPAHNEEGRQVSRVELYPKAYPLAYSAHFYKHGLSGATFEDIGALEGAIFVLSKDEGNRTLYLEESTDGNLTWTDEFKGEMDPFWAELLGDTFNDYAGSKENFNQSLAFFTSDTNGRVSTGDYKLPAGTYMFREVEAPEDFRILFDDFGGVEVTIPENPNEEILISIMDENGDIQTFSEDEAIYYNTDGELPETEGEEDSPEDDRELPPIEDETIPPKQDENTPPKLADTYNETPRMVNEDEPRGFLPDTGELGSILLCISGVFMCFLYFISREKKKK